MVTKRYRTLYAMLLRLYPRPFREQFADGMAQTFHDLCREHQGATRGLFRFTLWIFCETLAGIVRETITHMSQLGKTMLRVAPQVVDGWNWNAGAFVFVYILFFGTGMVYAVIAKKMGAWSYKAGVGVALVAGFALGWSNMVHVAGTRIVLPRRAN